jgi:hypothetical protein
MSDALMPAAEATRRLRRRDAEAEGPVLPGVGPVQPVPPPLAACRRGEPVQQCQWGRDCRCRPEREAALAAGG